MTRTVIALYDDFAQANAAVRELVDNGFAREDISLMANDTNGNYSKYLNNPSNPNQAAQSNAAAGAGLGAGLGAVIGGLGGVLIGLGALVIPGIGPVIAAGPLAAAITGLAGAGAGAVAGGVTGGLIGALGDMGVPKEAAQYYAEGVRRGGTLLSVRCPDDLTQKAVEIMNHHDAVDINERSRQWKTAGAPAQAGMQPQVNPPGINPQPQPVRPQPVTPQYSQNPAPGLANTGNEQTATQPPTDSQTRRVDEQGVQREEYQHTDVTTDYADFNTYDNNFRDQFAETFSGTGYTYEQYLPAYRYGYDLATNKRFTKQGWADVEPEAAKYWNDRNPGTWDQVKEAVRYAWETVKNSV